MDAQDRLDYANDAQVCVAADTLALTSAAAITVPAGGSVALPDDVVQVIALTNANQRLEHARMRTLVTYLAAAPQAWLGCQSYTILGRTLYLIPTPSEDVTLTITYHRRPTPFISGFELELSEQYDELTKGLIVANAALDGGEPEVGATLLGEYDQDAARLKRAKRATQQAAPVIRVLGDGAPL